MEAVANIHIREVPPDTVAALKVAARLHRRSLNSEIVDALIEHAKRTEHQREMLERMEDVRRSWREAYPDGFPPGLEPETTIRQDRERDDL